MKLIKQRNKIKFSTFIIEIIFTFNVVLMILNLPFFIKLIVGALSTFTMIILFLLSSFKDYIESRAPKLLAYINKIKEQNKEKIIEKKLEILKAHINNRANNIFWSGISLLMLDLSIYVFCLLLYKISGVQISQNSIIIILAEIIALFVPLSLSGYYLGKNLKELRKIQSIMIESIDKESKLEDININF